MRDLTGKVAVVTGAGSGIGRATALALARQGAHVAVCDLNGTAAKETTDAVIGLGVRASAHEVDVSVEADMSVLPEAVLAEHGVVDVVINNAGIVHAPTLMTDFVLDRFERLMQVNFWGVVYGSRAFLPYLTARPAANLVNVASYAGLVGVPRMGPYVSSKFAVRGFTETLRMELSPTSVRVTMVFPGATCTPIGVNSPVMDDTQREAMQQTLNKGFAVKPETVAKAIVKAIQRDRARTLIGPDSALLDALARVLPGSYASLIARPLNAFLDKTQAKDNTKT